MDRYAMGQALSGLLGQFDSRRPNRMSTPALDARRYPVFENADNPAPRVELTLNPDALQPENRSQGDVQHIADTTKYGDFSHIGINVGTATPQLILSRAPGVRTFLLIQNTHATQSLFVGFGVLPSSTIGITLPAGGNLLLDAAVAQDDVYVLGSGANTTGLLTYCNKVFGQG